MARTPVCALPCRGIDVLKLLNAKGISSSRSAAAGRPCGGGRGCRPLCTEAVRCSTTGGSIYVFRQKTPPKRWIFRHSFQNARFSATDLLEQYLTWGMLSIAPGKLPARECGMPIAPVGSSSPGTVVDYLDKRLSLGTPSSFLPVRNLSSGTASPSSPARNPRGIPVR